MTDKEKKLVYVVSAVAVAVSLVSLGASLMVYLFAGRLP